MLAPGGRAEFQQHGPVMLGLHGVMQAGGLRFKRVRLGDVHTVFTVVVPQPIVEGAPLAVEQVRLGSVGRPHHGEVGLLDGPATELLAQPCCGLAGACEQQHPAGGFVEAMHHTEKHFPRLGVLLLQIGFGEMVDGFVRPFEVRTGPTRRLVQCKQVVVLVQHVQQVGVVGHRSTTPVTSVTFATRKKKPASAVAGSPSPTPRSRSGRGSPPPSSSNPRLRGSLRVAGCARGAGASARPWLRSAVPAHG